MIGVGNEAVYFSDDAVSVTSTRIITGGTTYPLNGITAVSCTEHKFGGRLMGMLMMGVGAIMALALFLGGMPVPAIVFAALFVGLVEGKETKPVLFHCDIHCWTAERYIHQLFAGLYRGGCRRHQ